MFWLNFLMCSILQFACATPTPYKVLSKRENAIFTLKRAEAIASKRDLDITDNILLLKEVGTRSQSSRALLSASQSNTEPLSLVEGGGGYGVDVELGGQSFTLVFDTGSSDLWVAQTGFQCVEPKGNTVVPVSESKCDFGPLFSGQFQGGKVPDKHFIVAYGDGEEVAGVLGYEDVTVAGVTVNNQEIASVELAYFLGDGVISGILGFAYSTITNAYKGNDITTHRISDLTHYTNFIGNAIKQGKINPVFSIVLERPGGQSQLALGGLPSISYNHDFTTVPLEIVEFSPKLPIGATKYTYYTIQMDGVVLNGNTVGASLDVVVDSGTSLIYLPHALAAQINGAFDPPATYKPKSGVWETSCNAKPPSFAITIGGTNFKINAAEVLLSKSLGYDPNTGLCATGINSLPAPPYILGDTFLKNVVAVFDIGAAEMRFAPHVNY